MLLRQKIFFILFGLILTLAISELFLRLHPKFGYRYHFFKFGSKESLSGEMIYMRPSALLGYEYIPNCRTDINTYGLSGKEYRLEKGKDIFRILILGDSVANGFPNEFLEAELNDEPKLCSKYRFEVWNAGVASYEVRRYALYLKLKGLNYNPDMVIIFLFMNDFGLNTEIYYKTKNGVQSYCFPSAEISKICIPNPFLMKHSYLYRFIILRLDSFLIGRKKTQGIDLSEENGRYYLRMIKQICQRNNIPLFVVIFPYLESLDVYEDWQMDEYAVICKVVKDLKIAYLNLHNLYARLLEENFPLKEHDEDGIHPSREAYRLIAREISSCALDNFFSKAK